MTTIAGKAVLVTGASRGIGQALVAEALARGARHVYAAARQPLSYSDARVTPLVLDVTSPAQVRAAAAAVESLDILVNNAGLGLGGDLSDRAAIEAHLAVNLYGTYDVTQAFLPLLAKSGGTVVNVSSLAALPAVPAMAAYSISKGAAFSRTQALSALLATRGVRAAAALP